MAVAIENSCSQQFTIANVPFSFWFMYRTVAASAEFLPMPTVFIPAFSSSSRVSIQHFVPWSRMWLLASVQTLKPAYLTASTAAGCPCNGTAFGNWNSCVQNDWEFEIYDTDICLLREVFNVVEQRSVVPTGDKIWYSVSIRKNRLLSEHS